MPWVESVTYIPESRAKGYTPHDVCESARIDADFIHDGTKREIVIVFSERLWDTVAPLLALGHDSSAEPGMGWRIGPYRVLRHLPAVGDLRYTVTFAERIAVTK
jgi:hypothetical protein